MSTIYSEGIFSRHAEKFRPYLSAVGLPETILYRPDIEVPIRKWAELMETVARHSHPSIGLEMGTAIEPPDLGVFGHTMAASNTVAQMLEVASHYLYVFSHSNQIRVDTGQKRVIISYRFTDPKIAIYQQDVEFATAAIFTMLKKLTGREIQPRHVDFEHRKPEYARLHSQVFGCEVRFGRRGNRIHLGKKVLDLPILSADASLFNVLESSLAEQLKIRSEEGDLVTKVNHLINVMLSEAGADIKVIARKLGVSERTLQRKLATEGQVFSEMVDAVRRAIAIEYVQQSDYSLTDIALMVGYSELSTFSRAFKRWTGSSPLQVRGHNN
jgi:AraC-like DNA-binding protein